MHAEFMRANLYLFRGLIVAAILSLALCLDAEPPQTQEAAVPPAAHSAAQKQKFEGVKNFGEVTPTLYRGGQPSREGFEALAKMGVNIVVDGRLTGADKERERVNQLGMQYVSIPWHCLFPRDQTFARFLAVLRDNPGKKVFVHCRYGDDRTGMMVAAYRMAVEGWSADEARREMEQFGFKPLVCPSLVPYEKRFPGRLKKNPTLQGPASSATKN
jgi:tyrosine-protein phosphatase SIW14